MNSNSYRSKYIASLTGNNDLSENSIQAYGALWNRIARAESEIEKTLEEGYTREEYMQLFRLLGITSVFVLAYNKTLIGKYLKYLCSLNVLDQGYVDSMYSIVFEEIEPDRALEAKFFKDFASLQKAIEDTLQAASRVDENVFATQIAAIYLAWCGVKIDDLVGIKKTDVHDDFITVNGEEIRPLPIIMDYIKTYRDATAYESQARGIITLKYVPSEYLFRTTKAESISPKSLRIYIRNFGKSSEKSTDNIFNYDKVYLSGVYNRVYEYESINGALTSGEKEKIENVFGEVYQSKSIANKKLRDYQNYKRYFYPEPKGKTDLEA